MRESKKGKVGLEALRGVKTINEIGPEYGVHPVQASQWKKEIQAQARTLFEGKRGPQPVAAHYSGPVFFGLKPSSRDRKAART